MHRYLAAMFLLTAGATSAQQFSVSDRLALRDNCKQDVEKLCPDLKPGGGELLACMRTQKDQLSEACSAIVAELQAKRKNEHQ